MNTRATLKDVAIAVGVSPATVSRALSDSELVAEPTRSRIRETAARLNYRPNVSARNLRTQRSMAVLMVVRDVGNPFYLEILKGVESTARAAGYAVLMGNTENNAERETEYFNMLRDGHADGMILITGKLPQDPGIAALVADLPIVVALEQIEGAGFPHVMIDNVAAARTAVEHLVELGHHRIAHVAGPIPELMATRRSQGYREAMAQAGLDVPAGYELVGDYLLGTGMRLCAELMDRPDTPTAIFVANDEMAFGVIAELRRRGLSVPEDVSVVGFDDLFLSQAFHPPLTTVSQPRGAIGQQAMRLLLEVLAGKRLPGHMLEMPTRLEIRGSTARCAEAAPPAPTV
jgi:LacI family transcriptional regulator, repressor for deo operon, udp, cdd, tsx, nupC, and nupG